jgi:hypothetical protein
VSINVFNFITLVVVMVFCNAILPVMLLFTLLYYLYESLDDNSVSISHLKL